MSLANTKTRPVRGMIGCPVSYLACDILNPWIKVSFQLSKLCAENSNTGSTYSENFQPASEHVAFSCLICVMNIANEGSR